MPKPGDWEYDVAQLADDLAEHYVEMGRFGTDDSRSFGTPPGGVRTLPRRRIVAVVGAGASADAGLDTGTLAIDAVKERVLPTEARDRYAAELVRLQSVYRLEPTEFETALLAIASIGYSKELRDGLKSMYSLPSGTLLQYEILAHLLKHHFLDAIINFNFDELLDRAIEDELRPDEFLRVLSDGDCPIAQYKDFGLPVYVKPHGTVSHPSTLRFTREAYFGTPLDIHRLLGDLLTQKPVTLLVVGFNMQSFEFNLVLGGAHAGTRVFHFNLEKPKADPKLPSWIPEVPLHVRKADETEFDERPALDERPPTLGSALRTLWAAVEERVNGGTPAKSGTNALTRGIDRHTFVAKVFHAHRWKARTSNDYLRDRCAVELALSVAKTKGLVTVSALTSDRCGQYYERLRRQLPGGHRASSPKTLHDLCLDIGLRDKSYGRQALRFEPDSNSVAPAHTDFRVVNEKAFLNSRSLLLQKLMTMVTHETGLELRRHEQAFFETLEKLYKAEEIEVRASPSGPDLAILKSPLVIRTIQQLQVATSDLLADPDWDLLLVSAETGEWLCDERIRRTIQRVDGRLLAFVVADDTFEDRLRAMYPNQVADFRRMNSWEHNRHMTIPIKKGTREPIGSIYFDRPRRSTDVTPLILGSMDSLVPLQIFAAYRTKATNKRASGRPLTANEYDGGALIEKLRELGKGQSNLP